MDYHNKMKLLFIVVLWQVVIGQNISYEIKSLFGQPDYRSVNLTWEVEDKITDNRIHGGDRNETKNFVVNYCEIQSWGEMHRCNSRFLYDDDIELESHSTKLYKMTISNLRMATKYSFHVRPQKQGESEKSARSQNLSKDDKSGQSIVIPTKGFSAIATKCLPNESEIVVETGPHFGGRISSENGECSIQGNAKDGQDAYTMRIDHERCGSQVSHEDLTVETYITVQENSGILTHSTRRFLVVCTFQPDTLTVRARLALPGKGDVIVDEEWNDRERTSRNRQFKMVDKSALILKEISEHSMENAIGDVENLTEKILAKEIFPQKVEIFNSARFSRYSSDNRQKLSFQFFDAFTGIAIGLALIALVAFIAFYIFRRDRSVQRMEKLTETTAGYN